MLNDNNSAEFSNYIFYNTVNQQCAQQSSSKVSSSILAPGYLWYNLDYSIKQYVYGKKNWLSLTITL